jgi:hypothetical protein
VSALILKKQVTISQTKLTLMHAMQLFKQTGNIEPSSKGTTTPLDSTAIYPINPVISHPLITL